MANTTKLKKTAKRASSTAKRTKAKWQKQMLDPEIKPTFIVLRFKDDGSICAATVEQDQQNAAALKAMSDQDRKAYFREASRVRALNPKLLKKTARDALSHLFVWAIATGKCEYGEWLTPRDQRELLDCFDAEAFDGIKEIKLHKQRYEIHDSAYEFAKPYLVRYRKARGIPNNQHLNTKQGKEAWAPINMKKTWARLVERHAQTLKKREGEGITQRLQRGANVIRATVVKRWKEEFS